MRKKHRGEPRHYTLPFSDCLAPQWPQNADILKEVSSSPHDSHCTMTMGSITVSTTFGLQSLLFLPRLAAG
eukprot:8131430-Karenia_brevis.AAC.1